MNKHATSIDRGFWRGAKAVVMVMATALGAATMTAPAQANAGSTTGFDQAHSLRSLDIMLMVTSLRCRSGPHDFRSDYNNFSAVQSAHLNAAGRTLRRSFAASYGETNPARALDRMGVKIANSYGDGHPWLNCAQLQQAARELSQSPDVDHLANKARYLLSARRPLEQPAVPRQIAQSQPVQIAYNMTADWEQRP
ncbi:S-adenosyl-L-homocysteine hydrolase [Erythrobacter longus]|nr:S-adenosyl-L-homocysteine hydrolase [Erythrobacter longus]